MRSDEAGQKVRDELETDGFTVDTIHAYRIVGTDSWIVDGTGFQHFAAKSFSALVTAEGEVRQLRVWTTGTADAFKGLT